MNTEERLTRALHDEAERVDPDVDRMYAATMRRLTKPGVRRTGELLWPLLVTVVVLALLVGSAVILQHHWQKTVVPAGTSKAGGVSTTFTCPGQITVDDAGRKQDDSFLPSIDGPPHVHVSQDRIAQAAADEVGAPRYSYVENGDDATLRLGNADGSLASVSTFHRTPAGWDLVTTTKCAAADGGILVPVDDPLRLGAHGTKPYPARSMIDNPASAVLVDDRSTLRRGRAGQAPHDLGLAVRPPDLRRRWHPDRDGAPRDQGGPATRGHHLTASRPRLDGRPHPLAGAVGRLRRRPQRVLGRDAAP